MEEGEIKDSKFPFNLSHIKYSFSPNGKIFIGKNSIPNFMNYQSDSICAKLKKELKSDYNFLDLENSKFFFENKFKKISELKQDNKICDNNKIKFSDDNKIKFSYDNKDNKISYNKKISDDFITTNYKDNYKNVSFEDFKKEINFSEIPKKDEKFFEKFIENEYFNPSQNQNTFVFEDKVLKELNNPNAYIYLRVLKAIPNKEIKYELVDSSTSELFESSTSEDKNLRSKDNIVKDNVLKDKIVKDNVLKDNIVKESALELDFSFKKFIFSDIFYNSIPFYEFVDLSAENILKKFQSFEIKKFSFGKNLYVIYSGTTFIHEGKVRNLYDSMEGSNTILLYNKDGIKPLEYVRPHKASLEIFDGLIDLKEGDYMINCNSIYKMNTTDGEKIEYKDIDYKDLINSYL